MEHQHEISVGALYIRVSTHSQDELSPDAQKRLCLEYAKTNHIHIPEDFIFTESISGRSAEKRPEFQKMIALAKSSAHPFSVILVWKFSRFARNQEESIVYKSMLKKDKVEVISVSEPLAEGPFGTLIERIIEWMDEYYSIRLSGEVKRGMKEKALRHGYQTCPCLGYNAVGKGKPFVINEKEFETVSFIMEQFDSCHLSPSRIAVLCNTLSYRTKRGNPFDRRAVVRILENPFYAGTVTWNGISFEGNHETRLSKEQYENRMKLLHSGKISHNPTPVSSEVHWLSGILKCSLCHAVLAFGGSRNCRVFTCWKYAKGVHSTPVNISLKKAETSILTYFHWVSEITAPFLFYMDSSSTDSSRLKLREEKALKQQLENLTLREQRIKEAYESGIDTLTEYRENKLRLQEQKTELENKLHQLSFPVSQPPVLPSSLSSFDEFFQNPQIPNEKKRLFLQSFTDEILFDKASNTLYFDIFIS
ncbi:MAG: recombinase family protein [Eubacteriales bacterium]|nr:recombinase family protein [Eubacteriales bacterium]